jgi:predicted ester cyclase
MADPKRVVERHVEAFNVRDADAEPWSDDADFVAPNASMHGREEVLGFLGVFWDAFPDGRLETSRLLAEGSVVAAEGRFIGTHTGVMRAPAGDVAATGRQVDFRWMSSYEVRGDELASEHLYFDQAELLGLLGLLPAAGAPSCLARKAGPAWSVVPRALRARVPPLARPLSGRDGSRQERIRARRRARQPAPPSQACLGARPPGRSPGPRDRI